MKDVMIDLETLGTKSTAAIVQIGACYFDRETGEIGQTLKLNIQYPNGFGPFTVDFGTVSWWLQQGEEARSSILGNAMYIAEAMEILRDFLKGADNLWAHATFDLPIIQHAFDFCNFKNPVHFRGMRDIRTLMDLADHRSTVERTGTHHDALDDCKFQVQYCVEALNKLKAHG